jgi:hypothetical protein
MNCPKCMAEVEEGAAECPNCGVALDAESREAYETPAGNADTELAEGKLVEVWSGEEEAGCVGTCKDLRKAGIPFKVSQHKQQRGKYLDEHYKIGVPAEFVEEAKKLIEAGEIDPEEISAEEVPEEGIDAGEEDDYDKGEDREEAKAEIWSGDAEDVGMIEMCLKENGIRAFVEAGEKGKKKISVKFEHEKKAKEIVKELDEGKPE